MDGAHLDFEWASPVDLLKAGTYKLAEHPATRVWCACWRINDGDVYLWRPGDADPQPLLDWVAAGRRVVAHNAAGAEWIVWNMLRQRGLPWPELRVEQLSCTMARCFALGLPGSLELAAKVLGLAQQKDHDGGKLAKHLAKPAKVLDCYQCQGSGVAGAIRCAVCAGTGEQYAWHDTPDKLARLYRYCAQDVLTECELSKTVPELTPGERDIWLFDCRMNARGVGLDIDLIRKAQQVVDLAQDDLDAEICEVTGGAVRKHTQTKELAAWITSRGIPCDSVAKGEQDDLILMGQLFSDPAVEQAIRIRQLGKSSTAKLARMLQCACSDDSARGQQQYHAAHTGREGGRLIQFQNLHRVDEEIDGTNADLTLQALEDFDPAPAKVFLQTVLGNPTELIAKSMRRFVKARRGKTLIGGDLANIEGCVNAWLPDETWKIEAYRAFQRGEGPDMYRLAYAQSFGGDPALVVGRRRQIGKVMDLAYGYQGSIGAFIGMGLVYNVRPHMIVPVIRDAASDDEWQAAWLIYDKTPRSRRYDLRPDEWTAVKITVDRYRGAHPRVKQGWWDVQDAAIAAVERPGDVVPVFDGRIRYACAGGFLWCMLPTGRLLAYYAPRLAERDDSTIELSDGTVIQAEDVPAAEIDAVLKLPGTVYKQRRKTVVLYAGRGSRNGQTYWGPQALYGGKQCENNVSGIARDVLFHGCLEAERRGYTAILTVHDEQLTEMPLGQGSAAELQALMELPVPGLDGLPLKAKCWQDNRYVK